MTSQNSYYAVIFTSQLLNNTEGYNEMAEVIGQLAKSQTGFLGMDSAKSEIGITVSYWKTLDDISTWKQNSQHLLAQKKGMEEWYDWYNVKICKVEREYSKN